MNGKRKERIRAWIRSFKQSQLAYNLKIAFWAIAGWEFGNVFWDWVESVASRY